MRNTSGVSDPKYYKLGKGIVYIAAINAVTGLPGAWRDVGNAPAFGTTIATTTLKHVSSRSGIGVTDREVVVSQDATLAFTLDEIHDENLAVFFSGLENTPTNSAVLGFTIWTMVADGDLQLGRWYDIVNSTGVRAYDIDAGSLTVATNQGTPVPMVLNTDYTVDEALGRIFILSTSTVAATSIGANKGLTVILAADSDATAVQEVQGLTQTSLTVAVKFVALDPTTGDHDVYEFRKVLLSADGEMSMIGTNWSEIKFKGSLQANVLGFPASPWFSHYSIPTP